MPDDLRRETALEVRREVALEAIGRLLGSPTSPREEDRLADAGLDSLGFVEVAAALERELGLDLGGADLGPESTVGALFRAIDQASARAAPIDLPSGTGGLQAFARVAGGWAFRWWFGLRVRGAEHVPKTGAAVLAMNHESALDIPLAVVACPRRVTFMAKKELFKNRPVSWALRRLGGFRVDRDRFDLEAVHRALAAVGRGEVLGMYPEGTRSPGRLLPFLPGAAWVALRTGAPIVACSLSGTEHAGEVRLPGRVRVRVRFHPPIEVARVDDPLERRRRAEELTARVRSAVERDLARPT